MVEPRDASERDESLVVAYVDGTLSPTETAAFETRLRTDDALAAMVDEFLQSKHMAHRLTRAGVRFDAAPSVRKPGPGLAWPFAVRPLQGIAALLAIAAAVAAWWTLRRAHPPLKVAVVASAPEPTAYHALLGLPRDVVPPGTTPRGNAPTARTVPVDEYLTLAHSAEQRRIATALADPAAEVRAPYYLVALELAAPATVVLVACDDHGPPRRLHPRPGAGPADRGLLPAGVHVLPDEPLSADPTDPALLQFAGGYLVPLGVREVWNVVAVAPTPTAPGLMGELDGYLATALPAAGAEAERRHAIEQWLDARGFVTRTFVVRE